MEEEKKWDDELFETPEIEEVKTLQKKVKALQKKNEYLNEAITRKETELYDKQELIKILTEDKKKLIEILQMQTGQVLSFAVKMAMSINLANKEK